MRRAPAAMVGLGLGVVCLAACACLGVAVGSPLGVPAGWTEYFVNPVTSVYHEGTSGISLGAMESPANNMACTGYYVRMGYVKYAGKYWRGHFWVTREDTQAVVYDLPMTQLNPPGSDTVADSSYASLGCALEDVPLRAHFEVAPLTAPMRTGLYNVRLALSDADHPGGHLLDYDATDFECESGCPETPTPTPTATPTPTPTPCVNPCPGGCELTEAQGVDFVNGVHTLVILLGIGVPCLVAGVVALSLLFLSRRG